MKPIEWRLAERQLSRVVPADRLTAILGDLAADHESVLVRRGRLLAALWMLRETASLLRAYRRPARRGHADVLRCDFRDAWRAIRSRPAAALGAIGVVSIGVGLVSAMFALADPFVTRPLPFRSPNRLVTLVVLFPSSRDVPTLEGWRARTDLFDELATWDSTETVVAAAGDREVPLRLLPVSANFMQVLAAAAPPLTDWRVRRDSPEIPVILTPGARGRLAGLGEPGSRIQTLNDTGVPSGRVYRVRGALPSSFLFPSSSQAWDGVVPLADGAEIISLGRTPSGLPVVSSTLTVIARLQAGVTSEQVGAALSKGSIDGRVFLGGGYVVKATPVADLITGGLKPLATGALCAGILVLLISAANLANLLAARGLFRRREFAAREAFGASGADLARLVLVEIGLLTIGGVAVGLLLAAGVLSAVAGLIPAQYVPLGVPWISARVIGFAAAAGGLVMIGGIVPALSASRVNPRTLFRQTSSGEPRGVRVVRFAMMAFQTGIAVVLLVGAMLMMRSYLNLLTRDPGYSHDVYAVGARYETSANGRSLYEDVSASVARLRRIDGVVDAAAFMGPLVEAIGGGGSGPALSLDGQRVVGQVRFTGPGFFQTAGARLLAGRLLTPADEGRAAIVTESLVRACCPDRPVIGRRLEWSGSNSRQYSLEVVGVIKDVLAGALDQAPVASVFAQFDERSAPTGGWVTYVVRADRPTPALVHAVERDLQAVHPGVRVAAGGLMRDRLMRSIQDRTFATLMVGLFTAAGVGVSAAGLVGIVGFFVGRRTREIAIRVAIGARWFDVVRLVTREAVLASGTGGLVGLLVGAWVSKGLAALLFDIQPADPISIALAAGSLVLVVATAAWGPSRRALRLSPVEALRVE